MTIIQRLLLTALTLSLALTGAPSVAQMTGGIQEANAQWRDGFIHDATGKLYVAVHDANEVWVIHARTGERLNRVAVGQAPVAIAHDSSTDTLAVVNRVGNSVSLIDRASERLLTTVAIGKVPASITALGQGRFAIAESFGDNVALVHVNGELSYPYEGIPPVPTFVAATGSALAVAGKGLAQVHIYPQAGGSATRIYELEAVPTWLAAGPGNTVLVGDGARLSLLSLDGAAPKTFAFPASDAISFGDAYYLLGPDSVTTLDAQGEVVKRLALSKPGQRLVVSKDWALVLMPQLKQWHILSGPYEGAAPLEIQEAAPLEMQEAAPLDIWEGHGDEDPAPVEALPVEEAEVIELEETPPPISTIHKASPAPFQSASLAQAQPEEASEEAVVLNGMEHEESDAEVPVEDVEMVEATPVIAAEEPQAAEPVMGKSDTPIEEIAQEPASAGGPMVNPSAFSAGAQSIAPSPGSIGSFQRYPMPTSSVRAPRAPIGDTPMSQDKLSKRSIRDALIQPTEFGSPEAGFQAPDWDEPLRDIEADMMTRDFNVNRIDLTGNVRLRLGDMLFSAESFSYTEDLGAMEASGDVLIQQERSRLTADYLHYDVPDPDLEGEEPHVFRPSSDVDDGAPRRLVLGRIKADGVSIVEPTRELDAKKVDYDFLARAGVFTHAHGRAGIFYWGADELRILGPADMEGDDVWVTTCDHDPPHYKIRMSKAVLMGEEGLTGSDAQLELLGAKTPLYLPRFRDGGVGGKGWTLDFDTGRRAEIGSYLNIGQRYEINREVALGPRLYLTQKEGIGFGGDIDYDFSDTPTSRLFRSQGQASGLYTTEDRGYVHWYHRWEYENDLVLRAQLEHWGDKDFYKDFYYDRFRNRTSPRSFAALTYRQPTYIAEGVAKVGTHGFVEETERLPEAAFYLLDRPLTERLHVAFDTMAGYYTVEPNGEDGGRVTNVARLTYDMGFFPAVSITPFAELEATYYTDLRDGTGSSGRFSPLIGITGQSRFHRVYPGRWGYSGFKHLIIPSITLSYRPSTSLNIEEAPRYDALDRVFGRTRIESKLSNILYGRDAQTGTVWQLARLTLYQGNDFWNESKKSDDYEIELDVRPRPWWGMQLVGEKHIQVDETGDPARFFQRRFRGAYESVTGRSYNVNNPFGFNTAFGDYERVLAQVYYDDTAVGGPWNGRVGFAYTATGDEVFNREILYGFGYRISEKWGLGFEHRYDFASKKLRSQTYEVRRTLHCWETAIRVRDRESGFDVDIEFNITAFPANRVKF